MRIYLIKFIYLFNILLATFLYSKEPITPIPTQIDVNIAKADLGRELFFDTRLSKDDTISCHSCHQLTLGGADNQKFSIGVEGRVGVINAPTIFNSRFNFVQFWNGRAKNLHEQAFGPIQDPNEMDMNPLDLIEKLNKTEYKNKFKKIYKNAITKENIEDAIVEYENSLITPNSPFDLYLNGDEKAISQEAKLGYQTFKNQGCIACHHGKNIGGNLYSKFGVVDDAKSISKGRFEVTNDEVDMYYFKVPTLRNIELTTPYLHDGRFDNLEDTVKFMANYQLGKSLEDEDIKNIVIFLKTLTGQLYEYDKNTK